MKPRKDWKFQNPEPRLLNEISQKFRISKVLSRLLINRGITGDEEINSFLKPTLNQLYNPFYFKDMEKAVERLRIAIKAGEKILIYGDRDVDGITSTTILLNILKYFDLDLYYKIPGSKEGYGFSRETLDEYIRKGVTLVISVDCGISNIEEVNYARQHGIDVIITDHHEPSDQIPEAYAILNPKIEPSTYPFKNLAGVGVTLKLVQGLLYSYHPDYNRVYAIIDFETTGYNPDRDEIIEVAVYKVKNNMIIDRFHRLVKPSKKIPGEIIEITGITNELVESEGENPETVIEELYEFMQGTTFIAHNAGFDWSFYDRYVKKYLDKRVSDEIIDTIPLLRSQFPGLPSLKLHAVADFMNIPPVQYHRAENDVKTLFAIFVELRKLRYPPRIDVFKYLDLVSLGTIADMVPLVSENRILAALGLTKIAFTRNIGLQTMYRILNLEDRKEIAENEISWIIAPILNAAGRIETGDIALKLLLTEDAEEAEEIVRHLIHLNSKRRQRTQENLELVSEMIESEYSPEEDKVIIIESDKIEHGVTGIVATKLKNSFYRPTFILIRENDQVTGAARSVIGINVIDVLHQAQEHLVQFGGHEYAAGFTMKASQVENFKEKIKQIVEEKSKEVRLIPGLNIDMELSFNKITNRFLNELDYLRPFGIDNEKPVFYTNEVDVINFSEYGKNGEHLKLRLRKGNKYFNAIGWNLIHLKPLLEKNRNLPVEIVYCLQRNENKKSNEIILYIEDIRFELC